MSIKEMKIFISGFGQVGKTLTDLAIKEKYEVNIISRRNLKYKNVNFLTIEQVNNLKITNKCFLISTVPPDCNEKDFVLDNLNEKQLKSFKKIIYISSTSVYPKGNVDENTKIYEYNNKGRIRFDIENKWKKNVEKLIIVRAGGIYSYSSNIMKKFLDGDHNVIVKENHYTNRIHIDDLIGIIYKALKSNISYGIINAVDESFYNTFDLLKSITEKFNLPVPKKIDYKNKMIPSSIKSFYEVSKKVKSVVVKDKLNYKLKHPDFKESLTNITKDLIKYRKNKIHE